MTKPIRLLVLAGGRSAEHEVSLSSAASMLQAIEGSNLQATVQVIDRTGRWLAPAKSNAALQAQATVQIVGQSGGLAPAENNAALRAQVADGNVVDHDEPIIPALKPDFDAVFPMLHGPYGEDGTVQGLFELANIPYVGPGVLASSLCMDKVMAKDVLATHGIPQTPYVPLTKHEVANSDPEALRARLAHLGACVFVKPANLGSSVGITKVTRSEELLPAIDTALRYDRRILVEQAVTNPREIEVGILGNDLVEVSPLGEVTYDAAFFDYTTKYSDGRATFHIPAQVAPHIASTVAALAREAYRLLDCAGCARADFLIARDGQVFLNEVNTIPGFTPLSMFPRLWQAAGLTYPQLIGKLVDLAIERHRARTRYLTNP